MFRNAQVGDKVWDFVEEWGRVVNLAENANYPLGVKFNNDTINSYTWDGKGRITDNRARLFWDEVKYEIPKKPFDLEKELRKLKVIKFSGGNSNYYLCWDNCGEKIEYYNSYWDEFVNYKFFSKSSMEDFMDNIKDKKITKEEFFRAYNNVFGGK